MNPAAENGAESVEEFRVRARTWLADTEIPVLPPNFDDRAPVLREWQRRLHAAGFIGIGWPVDVGGQGLTAAHTLAFSDELVRARAPQPVGSIGLEVVGPTILRYGTDEQRARFLPAILTGEHVWCQGFSEPDAGSDLASLRTSATIDDDTVTITGQKVWTSWATDADWCAVLVRTDPQASAHRGISYVLVDLRSPGVTIRPIVMINGDAEFNELFFDQVRVPLTQVLGGLGQGWKLAMDTLGWERAGYAIRRRIENEVAFTRLLGGARKDPSSADAAAIGRLAVHLRAFRAVSQDTAERLLRGDVPSPYDSVDKLLLGRTEQELTGVAFDLLGPRRMVSEPGDETWSPELVTAAYLYGRAASVYGGSVQIQRNIIAERLLGLPRER